MKVLAEGLVHGAKASPSQEHWKAAPSSPLKLIEVVPRLVAPFGAPLRVGAAGGVLSTVQVEVAAALELPAGSMAVIEMLWLPSARPLSESGLVQVVAVAPSSEHLKLAAPSALKVIEALRLDDGTFGTPPRS